MNKYLKYLFYFLIVAVLTNYVGFIRFIFNLDAGYTYTTVNGNFTAYENSHKSPKFSGITKKFGTYLQSDSVANDTILYRTFKVNPLKFWQWDAYLRHPRYNLPYISTKQVNANRAAKGMKPID